jgi:hypothetical protein
VEFQLCKYQNENVLKTAAHCFLLIQSLKKIKSTIRKNETNVLTKPTNQTPLENIPISMKNE